MGKFATLLGGPVVAGFAVRGFEIISKLALYLLTARMLGAAEAGLFFLCLTWASWLSTFGRMGIDRALTRHLGAELGLYQGLEARRTLVIGVLRVTAVGAALGLLTVLAARILAFHVFNDPALATPLMCGAIAVSGMATTFTLTAALAGAGRTTSAQFLQNAFWPALTVLSLLLGARDATTLVTAMGVAIWICGAIALAIFAADHARFAANLPPEDLASGQALEPMPPLMRTAWPLMVVEMVQATIVSLPVLLLGMVADAADVGAFSVALRISMLVWMVLVSLGTVASPRFATLHRRGDMAGLAALNRQIQLLGAGLGGGVCVMMIVVPETLLGILSPEFVMASLPLMILAAGQAVNALYTGQDVLLAMTGNGGTLQRLNLAQLAMVLLLSLVFIPLGGAVGAAIATAVATAQGGIGTAMVVRWLLPAARPLAALPMPSRLRPFLTARTG
ncbi:polysaccharide biosynthesis protein [Tistrella bauzanensis]|uniref:Polysaccharide biosynthesis protein n=1 Tax=Tistrella bauzanensis TaxID=657419 RepID=A0ABQ1ICB9_9PROT|nr:polysaccharide biosynthesis protein [Tistrella bauzanensis]